ncbi:exo-alpha-sialidase [Pirellulales bacterium]|nr:exo-alpha-sialidase [Pirellulales bacterium]
MSNRPFPWRPIALLCALTPNVANSETDLPPAARVTTVPAHSGIPALLDYEVQLQTILKHDDGTFLWFHPRVAAIPGVGQEQTPAVIMTLQKHLRVSDYFSGLHVMRTNDHGRVWSEPELKSELDWVREGNVDIAVADVTPGWHRRHRKLIAVGAQIRYNPRGEKLEDIPLAYQTAYAIFDLQTRNWTKWRRLEMPTDENFSFALSACAQWLVEPNGSLLLPFYHGSNARTPWSATVVRCHFDGDCLLYERHGTVLSLSTGRGFAEPSITRFQDRYFLTIRSDSKAYVTVSDDGLNYQPPRPWTFDDGQELGSYNTQQHWLAHSAGLFLCYTRRGEKNDHMFRHRAPLFIAQVDPQKLQVIRSTERILVPERGAGLGNFGAAAINENESWVTVGEYVYDDESRKRGADGSLFVARVIWSKPNRLAPSSAW